MLAKHFQSFNEKYPSYTLTIVFFLLEFKDIFLKLKYAMKIIKLLIFAIFCLVIFKNQQLFLNSYNVIYKICGCGLLNLMASELRQY